MAGRKKGPPKVQIGLKIMPGTMDLIKQDQDRYGLSQGQVLDRWAEDRRAGQRQAS